MGRGRRDHGKENANANATKGMTAQPTTAQGAARQWTHTDAIREE